MKTLLKHGYLFGSRTVRMTTLLARGRPWYMTLAMLLLMGEGALIGFGILLMTYPFASASGGEEAIRAILDDPNFRWKVAACFGGAIAAFFMGSMSVVLAMQLTVSTGRYSARKVGGEIIDLVRSHNILEMAKIDRPLIRSGGLEFAMRRSLRTLIRASFLIPRMVSFALTGIVSFVAVFVIDLKYGLFALIALAACAVPIYMMNRGVLKRIPEMESTMKRSMREVSGIFDGDDSGGDPFVANGDLDRSFRLQGYLMTVRYRAGIIKAIFLSVCLIMIGVMIVAVDDMNPGVILALVVALKVASGSLQGIVRMSTGVSRTLRDVTPALYADNPPSIKTTAAPVWPLSILAQDGRQILTPGDSIRISATRVIPSLALAMTAARVVDADECFVELQCFNECDGYLQIGDGSGKFAELRAVDPDEESVLTAKPGALVMRKPADSDSNAAAAEQEIELELELG